MSIVVIIEECASGPIAGRGVQQSGLAGYISESPVPVVPIQDVLSPIGQEKIVEAVVIVISNAYTTGPSRLCEAGLYGDISKRTVPVVMVKAVCDACIRTCEIASAEH